VLLWSILTGFSLLSALGFGYIYHKDKDKRKLMFALALAFASISYLSEMQLWDSTEVLKGLLRWSVLPIVSAVSIAVLSSLLKMKKFDKAFKIFLFTLVASIIMMIIQVPVNPLQPLLFQSMAFVVIFGSSYLYLTKKELPDLMFLLSILCFTSGGLGIAFEQGVPFVVLSYTLGNTFIALLLVAAKQSGGNGIANFFALERELEKTQQELEISQDQLMRAEYNFKSLVNVIADPVVIVDHKGRFLEINDKVVEVTGFSKEELLGKNFMTTAVVTAKSKAILIKNLTKRMMGIEVKPYDIEANTKSGETVFLELNANKIEYQGKGADLVVFRDITERKMIEEKREKYAEQLEEEVKERTRILRENEEKLRSIFNSSPDVIAVSDLKGNMVECNQANLDFLGFSTKDETIGRNSLMFVAKKDQQKVKETMKNVLNTSSVTNVEYTALNKDGHEIPAEFSASVIKDSSGNPTGFVAIIKNITERKRMENELRRYSEQLEELVEQRTVALKESQERLVKSERLAAIGQAATMVGHDLRNPLQAIENGIFYIKNELSNLPVSKKTLETLQAINSSIDYADNIVRDLQTFAVKREPIFRETDINAIVKDALAYLKTPENVETSIKLGKLPKIEADKDMIKRVFVNLAVNGMQAMEKGGGILKVSTKNTDGSIEVSFEDTGIGIKRENLKKLFTPFFTTKAQGMGVGLAICKRFVESHNGSIKVESEEGKGSIFTVVLPIHRGMGV
jgi:PAS domain S-box-containing protein